MKIVSKDGNTWMEKGKDGKTSVGFTKALIQELEECWHMLPAASNKVVIKEGQPLCSVETNDGLFCVASPTAGVITLFDNRAMNFPDKIGEETIIATISEEVSKEEPSALDRALADLARLDAEERARLQPRVAQAPVDLWANDDPVPRFRPAQPIAAAPAQQRFFLDGAAIRNEEQL